MKSKAAIRKQRDIDWINGEIRKRVEVGKKVHFKVEAMSFVNAVLDPELADHAGSYIWQAFETALGMTRDPIACYCCDGVWRQERVPVLCVFISFLAMPPIAGGLMAGVCPGCADKGHGEILRAVQRDFPYLADQPSYTSSQEPGHA